MAVAGCLVDVGHLAAGGAAGDVVLVEADLDAAPGVFVVGVGPGDDEVGAEAGGGEAGRGLRFGHVDFEGAD